MLGTGARTADRLVDGAVLLLATWTPVYHLCLVLDLPVWAALALESAVLGVLGSSGDYIQPYATALGRVILAVLLTAYVAILVMLRRMAVTAPLPRFLNLTERTTRRAGAGGL
mgnify:CR=1 FL=1